MRWKFTILGLLAAATLGLSPSAGRAQVTDAPASAEDLATASAEADRLIAGTGAAALFENVSSDGMAKVRHKASGLVCSYLPGAENNSLTLFPSSLPRGDDVGCNADFGPAFITYYATRYGPGYSATDSMNDAVAAIRNRFPDARPHEGLTATVEPPEGVTETAFAGLLIGPADQSRYTMARTAKVGEWIFKQRVTGEGGEDAIMANQIITAVFWGDVLRAAVKRSD